MEEKDTRTLSRAEKEKEIQQHISDLPEKRFDAVFDLIKRLNDNPKAGEKKFLQWVDEIIEEDRDVLEKLAK